MSRLRSERLDDLVPFNHQGEGTYSWSNAVQSALQYPLTRRKVLMTPLALTGLSLLPNYLKADVTQAVVEDQQLRFTLSDDSKRVLIVLTDVIRSGGELLTTSAEWTLDARGFGNKAKFELYPDGETSSAGTTLSDAAILRIEDASLGRVPGGSVEFTFTKTGEIAARSWQIVGRTNLWTIRRINRTTRSQAKDILLLGDEQGNPVPLTDVITGSTILGGESSAISVNDALIKVFNGLTRIVGNPNVHRDTTPSGNVGIQLSRDGIWHITRSDSAWLRPVIPELTARRLIITPVKSRVVLDVDDAEDQDQEHNNATVSPTSLDSVEDQPIICQPVGVFAIPRTSLSDFPHETDPTESQHAGIESPTTGAHELDDADAPSQSNALVQALLNSEDEKTNLTSLSFHVHDEGNKTGLHFLSGSDIGKVEIRAYPLDKRGGTVGNGIPTDVDWRCEAVIAGRWNLAVHGANHKDDVIKAGPFKNIDGVIRRISTASFEYRDSVDLISNEELTFAGIDASSNIKSSRYSQNVNTLFGSFRLRSDRVAETSSGWNKPASDNSGSVALNFINDPFKSYQGSPIWISSAGKTFNTGTDHARRLHWLEMNWLLLGSSLGLPDVSFSELKFDATNIVFFYQPDASSNLPRNYVWLGPSRRLSNGDLINNLRIDLSAASLKASRHTDLLSLKFSFGSLFLTLGNEARIVPEGPMCGIHERTGAFTNTYQSDAAENVNDADKREGKRLRVLETVDTRPLLIVEFPPQHMLEEAFFRRVAPPSPDVDLTKISSSVIEPILRLIDIDGRPDEDKIESYPQLDDVPKPPDEGTGCEGRSNTLVLDITDANAVVNALQTLPDTAWRALLRERIRKIKSGDVKGLPVASPATDPVDTTFFWRQVKVFTAHAKKFEKELNKPGDTGPLADQLIYIGPLAMAPDVSAINRVLVEFDNVAGGPKSQNVASGFQEVSVQLNRLLKAVQEGGAANFDPLVLAAAQYRLTHWPTADKAQLLPIENYLESQVPVYQLFRIFYREQLLGKMDVEKVADANFAESLEFVFPQSFPDLFLQDNWIDRFADLPVPYGTGSKPIGADVLKEFVGSLTQTYPPTVEARLARPSRLSFRINCRDALVDARNESNTKTDADNGSSQYDPDPAHGHGIDYLPFTLAALTDWSSMELSVVDRAQRVFAPAPGGRLDQSSARTVNLHGAAKLDQLGFAPTHDPETRKWAYRSQHIVQSLQDAPTWFETSLELPARLVLSPSQQALFKVPSGVNRAIFESDEALRKVTFDANRQPVTRARDVKSDASTLNIFAESGDTRLWSAELLLRDDVPSPQVRAVHSPDLSPNAIMKIFGEKFHGNDAALPGYAAPPKGPLAPWLLSSADTSRAELHPDALACKIPSEERGLQGLEALQCPPKSSVEALSCQKDDAGSWRFAGKLPGLIWQLCDRWKTRPDLNNEARQFRSSLDAFDRHELVLLSSAYGLPVMPRPNPAGKDETSEQASQFRPDVDYQLLDLLPAQEIYRPRSLDVSELTMTSLGASFAHDTSFTPPASAKFYNGDNLFDALSIGRWQHETSLGRDIHCEVVYKGYLYPMGFRAALVKVTERIFARSRAGTVKAYLRQRMFIRCADRQKNFSAVGQAQEGRRMPASVVRLLTAKTPNIIDPTSVFTDTKNADSWQENATGRLVFAQSPGLVFWPRTAMARQSDIRFELEFDDAFTTLPMMFVDNVAANDPGTLRTLARYYNDAPQPNRPDDSRLPTVESPDMQPDPFGHYTDSANNAGNQLSLIDPSLHRRTLLFSGRKIRYADEEKTGSASVETDAITLRVEGRQEQSDVMITGILEGTPYQKFDNSAYAFTPVLQGADQPPFYPAMETARIRLEQNARLTGVPAKAVRACYDGFYVSAGFDTNKDNAMPSDVSTRIDVFLNLIDGVRQDMGGEGASSGGIYRPNSILRALSRKNGPIALQHRVELAQVALGNLPAFSAALGYKQPAAANPPVGVGAIPQPASNSTATSRAQITVPSPEDLLSNVFGDTKLLGLVSLSEIIAELVKPAVREKLEGQVPVLVDSMERGVTSVAQGLDEAVDTVQLQVIKPLAAIMEDVETRWQRLDSELEQRQRIRRPALSAQAAGAEIFSPVTLAELFPELDRSLTEFSAALTTAASADNVAVLGTLSSVYESGQRFLRAIQRAAADPVERFESALQTRFDSINSEIREVEALVNGLLHTEFSTFKTQLVEQLVRLMLPANPTGQLIIPLPVPASFLFSIENLAPGIRGTVQRALALSVNDIGELLKSVLTGLLDGENPFQQGSAFSMALMEKLVSRRGSVIEAAQDLERDLIRRLELEMTAMDAMVMMLFTDIEALLLDIEVQVDNAKANTLEHVRAQVRTVYANLADELEGELKDKLEASTQRILSENNTAQFLSAYYQVQSLALFYVTANNLKSTLEQSIARGDNPLAIAENAERFLSHLIGRKVSFVSQLKIAAQDRISSARVLIAGVLKDIKFTSLGLLSIKDEGLTCNFSSEKIESLEPSVVNKVLVNGGTPVDLDTENPLALELLQALYDSHVSVISANKWFTENKEFPDAPLGLLREVDVPLLLETYSSAVKTAHVVIGTLYCSIIKDAAALSGLDARIAELVEQLGAETEFDPDLYPVLASELQHLLNARKLVVRRTLQTLSDGIETIKTIAVTAMNPQLGQQTLFVATVALMEWAENEQRTLSTDLEEALIEFALAAIDLIVPVIRSLSELVEGIRGAADSSLQFVREKVQPAVDHFPTLAVSLEDSIRDLQIKLDELPPNVLLTPEWSSLIQSDTTNPSLNTVADRIDLLNQIMGARWLEPLVGIDVIAWRSSLQSILNVTELVEMATKDLQALFDQKLQAIADEWTLEIIEKFRVAEKYNKVWDVRKGLIGTNNTLAAFAAPLLVKLEKDDTAFRLNIPGNSDEFGYTRPTDISVVDYETDRLAADRAWLHQIAGKMSDVSVEQKQAFVSGFAREWLTGQSSPQLMIEQTIEQVSSLLRGDINLDELFNIRAQVEAHILNLIPSKQTFELDVDFKLPVAATKALTLGILAPRDNCRLSVGALTTIDLLPDGVPDALGNFKPKVTSKALATLGAFDIKLVGEIFDAVTLRFGSARFVSDLNADSDFKLDYQDFVIGEQLKFIEDLQSYMTPSEGSGAFVQALVGSPGIEAGYGLNLGTIMLGNIVFANISLNASAVLPFDGGKDKRALFKASLSRRESPFTIAYIPYGGSGYFSITADTSGIVGFEMSLEFGGAAPFQFGPLTGQGRIMVGFFIRQMRLATHTVSELSATFFVGGSASIWVFNFSASLYVRLGKSGDNMSGLAIFTFSFSMGIADFDYSIRFEKTENKGFSGDGVNASILEHSPSRSWGVNKRKSKKPSSAIITDAICQSEDWIQYRSYFDQSIDLG